MTETDVAQRTWTEVGREYIGTRLEGGARLTRRRIEQAIDAFEWIDTADEPELPIMPALGIEQAVREYRIPKVSRIAYRCKAENPDEELDFPLAPHGFYGIEGHYKNGRARVYVLDLGSMLVCLASDLYPNEER